MTTPTTTPSGETYDQTVNTLATLQDQLVDMAEGFVRALPNMAIALVIIVITWIVARIAVRGVSRAIGKTDMRPSLQNLIDTVVKLGIWIVGLMIALIVASFWSWAIIVYNLATYRRAKREARRFDRAFWSGEPLDELVPESEYELQQDGPSTVR